MNNLEPWQNFLTAQALDFELCDRETAVFKRKFVSSTEISSDSQTYEALE